METPSAIIAEQLLKIKAVRLQVENPFTWASGWRSPVYCDNRVTLSFPALRTLIAEELVRKIKIEFPEANGVAGVATAGIPQGALVADRMGLPFIYIRSAPKKHGMGNQIEGQLDQSRNYVVIEDLISTGGSSIAAVEALREAGGKALAVVSVFDYGFAHAQKAFQAAQLPSLSIVNLNDLLAKAVENNYIQPREMDVIQEWRSDPVAWTDKILLAEK